MSLDAHYIVKNVYNNFVVGSKKKNIFRVLSLIRNLQQIYIYPVVSRYHRKFLIVIFTNATHLLYARPHFFTVLCVHTSNHFLKKEIKP